MNAVLKVYRAIRDNGPFERTATSPVTKVGAHIDDGLSPQTVLKALEHLENMKLVVLSRGPKGILRIELAGGLPNQHEILAMGETVKAKLVHLVLLEKIDPSLQAELPTDGLAARITAQFPFLTAESIISGMTDRGLIPKPKKSGD
ncbi:MAG TPA: hypothetical protein VFO38_04370 [Candidatus Saccharimonadales bacterium]|nr:hypothetical protein [Candidatus Saccharimonadales bacterium]